MPSNDENKRPPPKADRKERAGWPSRWGAPSRRSAKALLDGLLAETEQDLGTRGRRSPGPSAAEPARGIGGSFAATALERALAGKPMLSSSIAAAAKAEAESPPRLEKSDGAPAPKPDEASPPEPESKPSAEARRQRLLDRFRSLDASSERRTGTGEEPAPKADGKPEKADAEPAAKVDAKPAAEADVDRASEPDRKAAPKADPKPARERRDKPAAKVEAKPARKVDKPVGKPAARVRPKRRARATPRRPRRTEQGEAGWRTWVLPGVCLLVVAVSGAVLFAGPDLQRVAGIVGATDSPTARATEAPQPPSPPAVTAAKLVPEPRRIAEPVGPEPTSGEEPGSSPPIAGEEPNAPVLANVGVEPGETSAELDELSSMAQDVARLVTEYEVDEAQSLVDQLLERDPENIVGLVAQGRIKLLRGDEVGAMTAFNAALSNEPGTTAARLGRMEALIGLGQAALVADLIDEIAVDEPGLPAVYDLRAHANAQLGNLDDARNDCAELARMTAADFVGDWCLGLILREAGDAAAASEAFADSIATAPEVFVINRQQVLKFRGHYVGAIDGKRGEILTAALQACARDADC